MRGPGLGGNGAGGSSRCRVPGCRRKQLVDGRLGARDWELALGVGIRASARAGVGRSSPSLRGTSKKRPVRLSRPRRPKVCDTFDEFLMSAMSKMKVHPAMLMKTSKEEDVMVDCPAYLAFGSRPQVEPESTSAPPQPVVGDYVSAFIGNGGHIDRKKGIRDIKNEGASGYVDENTCGDKMSWPGADLCASIRAGGRGTMPPRWAGKS